MVSGVRGLLRWLAGGRAAAAAVAAVLLWCARARVRVRGRGGGSLCQHCGTHSSSRKETVSSTVSSTLDHSLVLLTTLHSLLTTWLFDCVDTVYVVYSQLF